MASASRAANEIGRQLEAEELRAEGLATKLESLRSALEGEVERQKRDAELVKSMPLAFKIGSALIAGGCGRLRSRACPALRADRTTDR